MRPVFVPAVLRVLGLRGRRYALFRPVLGGKGRQGPGAQLRHDIGLHDDGGAGVRVPGRVRAGAGDAGVHGQAVHPGHWRAVSAHRGLCVYFAGAVHGYEQPAAGHGAGAYPHAGVRGVRGDEYLFELGFYIRAFGRAGDGHSGRGPGDDMRRGGERDGHLPDGAGHKIPPSVPGARAFPMGYGPFEAVLRQVLPHFVQRDIDRRGQYGHQRDIGPSAGGGHRGYRGVPDVGGAGDRVLRRIFQRRVHSGGYLRGGGSAGDRLPAGQAAGVPVQRVYLPGGPGAAGAA